MLGLHQKSRDMDECEEVVYKEHDPVHGLIGRMKRISQFAKLALNITTTSLVGQASKTFHLIKNRFHLLKMQIVENFTTEVVVIKIDGADRGMDIGRTHRPMQ